MTTTINLTDSRLTAKERTLLCQIAHRLDNWQDYQPPAPRWTPLRQDLPEGYKKELDRVFGGCADDGDLSERGKP
jgi:hypothetical protein